jgi:hypothetical protein
MRGLTIGFLSLLFSSKIMAEECRCQSIAGSSESIFKMESVTGHHLQLRFEANPVTTKTALAFLCTDYPAQVTQAKLWMPDMGHGSGPTKLTSIGDTCTKVEKINFLMDGTWEMRVKLSDNDSGVFSFDVTEVK